MCDGVSPRRTPWSELVYVCAPRRANPLGRRDFPPWPSPPARLDALARQTSCSRGDVLRRCLTGALLKSTIDAQALTEVSRVHANLNRIGGLLELAIREGVSDRSTSHRRNLELACKLVDAVQAQNTRAGSKRTYHLIILFHPEDRHLLGAIRLLKKRGLLSMPRRRPRTPARTDCECGQQARWMRFKSFNRIAKRNRCPGPKPRVHLEPSEFIDAISARRAEI